MKKIILFLVLFFSKLTPDVLFTESFNQGSWPAGWTYETYDGGSSSNWKVGSDFVSNIGYPAPAALFYYSPRIPVPIEDVNTTYELFLFSPNINISENQNLKVEFGLGLKFWTQINLHINGLTVEYNGGQGWVEVLNYEINPEAGLVSIPYTTESFIAEVSNNNLQIRWKAYGTDSYYIDTWAVDDVKVITLPKLANVNIVSNNQIDTQAAITGDQVTVTFTSVNSFNSLPYVQINNIEVNTLSQGGGVYKSSYIVQNSDLDGPIIFSIDFTTIDGVDGSTVRSTSDGTSVVIDGTGPPNFSVGIIEAVGGNVFQGKWNSTNTNIKLTVDVPQDSAVINFEYYQGNSISFDGTNDKVNIVSNSNYQFTNNFTLESWISPVETSNYISFLNYSLSNDGGQNGGIGFVYFATGWKFFIKTTDFDITLADMIGASAPVNQWTHMAATYDGSELILFRNGVETAKIDITGDISWSGVSGDLKLGSFVHNGTEKFYNGKLDDIRLWNVVRTPSQIKGYRYSALEGSENGLVGYWKADNGLGTVLYDQTSSLNNGQIIGTSWLIENSPINFSDPIYDTGVIIGSEFQLRGRVNSNNFESFGEKISITQSDFNATQKAITSNQSQFELLNEFSHGNTANLSALLFDQAGNFSLGDTSITIVEIDLIANNPTPVNIVSNNSNNISLAKTGDIITINMEYDEDVNIPTVLIENNSSSVADLGSEKFKATYILNGSEPEGILNFIIDAVDYMGNPGSYNNSTDGSQVNYDKTPPTLPNVTISSNNLDNQWAKVNDIISIIFSADEQITVSSVSILGQIATTTSLGNNQFKSDYTGLQTDTEGLVDIEIQYSDLAGNNGGIVVQTTDNSQVTFDKTPPLNFVVGVFNSLGGNEINNIWNLTNTSLSIIIPIENDTTLEEGEVQILAKIGGNNFSNISSLNSILSNQINSEKIVSLSAQDLENHMGFTELDTIYINAIMNDRAGNITNGSQSLTKVLIDQTPATITPVSIISNNNISSLAKVDDQVEITFTSSEILTDTLVLISGQTSQVLGSGTNQFEAIYNMQISDPEGIVTFNISYTDIQGNPFDGITQTSNGSSVIFDRTKPQLDVVTILSDNLCNSGSRSKAGDTVTISFSSDEPLLSLSATILDSNASITDLSNDNYEASYIFNNSDNDGETTFIISLTDLSGNVSENITATSDQSIVTFDKTPPVLSMMHIESNNNFNTIAVPDDEITLSFQPNESLLIAIVTINGDSLQTTLDGDIYSSIYTVKSDDEGGFIPFTVQSTDCVGNLANVDSLTTDESFVSIDVGPPSIVSVKIFSTNEDTSYAKVGDTVFVKFIADEPLNNSSNINILGDNQIAQNISNTTYFSRYVLTDNDIEGKIDFSILYFDLGGQAGDNGNPYDSTTNSSYVIFDKSKPLMNSISFLSNNDFQNNFGRVGDSVSLNFSTNEGIRNSNINYNNTQFLLKNINFDYSSDTIFLASWDEGHINLEISIFDSAGNNSDTTLNNIFYDKTKPYISRIFDGDSLEDKDYLNEPNTFSFFWDSADNISGVRSTYVAIGSDSGQTDILSWTLANNISSNLFNGLSLQNDQQYFPSLYLQDSVGNISDSIWSDGFITDLVPPDTGYAWDGFYIEDVDYLADSTELVMRWKDFSDNQIIDKYEVSLGSLLDTNNIVDWRSANELDSVHFSNLSLQRGIKYYSYIRAIDGAGNISKTISTDGVEFDNQPPQIVKVLPYFTEKKYLSALKKDTIKILFNKPILNFKVSLISSQDSSINYTVLPSDSSVIISINDTLPTSEIITVYLDTALALNLLNISDTIFFYSQLWGDLDSSYTLTLEDVLLFNQNWPESITDLGPVIGSPPFYKPTPDGILDLNDLVVFGRMWNNYYENTPVDNILFQDAQYSNNYDYYMNDDEMSFKVPLNAYAGTIIFKNILNNKNQILISKLKENTFFYSYVDSINNLTIFSLANKNGLDSLIKIDFKNIRNKTNQSLISYRFIDEDLKEITNKETILEFKILPKEFELYQNYPNPFNNFTEIKFYSNQRQKIKISVYNLLGKEIYTNSYLIDGEGLHSFKWNAINNLSQNISSGIYMLKVSANNISYRKKMVYLK